jgi:(4S)-4-hydroxy-5-phosphonooxypentane-2,3-dione isomerase
MRIACVHVHVVPEHRDDFVRASLENAKNSLLEPGVLRFDVIQQTADPNCFLLYEVYRDEAGMKAHKETAHYAKWRDTVAPWMAEPRQGVQYASCFPEAAEAWAARRDR